MSAVVPVVLCGGEGARLWPVSSGDRPKIFLEMPDGRTLMKHALERAMNFASENHLLAVTNQAYAFRVREQFLSSTSAALQLATIMEPVSKNTAAAIASAARFVAQKFGHETILLCLPADHITKYEPGFRAAVTQGIKVAETGEIVLVGLPPTSPNPSFGYIMADGERVVRFVEKPTVDAAKTYLKSPQYLWNSGMVIASAKALLDVLALHAPQVLEVTDASLQGAETLQIDGLEHVNLPDKLYEECQNISFDHAVLERTDNLRVIRAEFEWKDIGSWESYGALSPADAQGNHVAGGAILLDTKDSIIHAQSRTVAVAGLKDVIVVETVDAVLVAGRGNEEHIRDLFEAVKRGGHADKLPAYLVKKE